GTRAPQIAVRARHPDRRPLSPRFGDPRTMVAARPRLDRRTTTLLIAAVLAMGTGPLTFNYLTSVGRHQSAVVIAARDIVAHIPIKADMVTTVMRPGDAVEPDSIGDPTSVVGRIAAVSIPAGGSISGSKITTAAATTLVMRVP